jgi:hypothetical protein
MGASGREWYPEYRGASAEQYEFALSQISLSDREKAMLRVHYYEFGGKACAQQLAQGLGWSHYGVANIAVGTLGRKIATVLDIVSKLPAVGRARRPELWTAYTTGTSTPEGFMWTLRPNFVVALIKQPWMEP